MEASPTRNLILTHATGTKHKSVLAETIGQLRRYAERIGAELRVDTAIAPGIVVPHYRKLSLIREGLESHDRVCWIDADILVSDLAPSIFDEVPATKFGIFNEAPWVGERHQQDRASWASLTGFEIPDGTYYNTGVMVASREHLHLFQVPEFQINHYGEQTWFNQRLIESKFLVHPLSYLWNRMSCTFRRGTDPYVSHFIHFAGMEPEGGLPAYIRQRLLEWRRHGFKGGSQIFIVAGGGMGNQVATLPVVEEIMRLHPDSTFGIHSAYEEVFKHLESPSVKVFGLERDDPEAAEACAKEIERRFQFSWVINTYKPQMLNMTHMNSTDFHALAALGRQIVDREIRIPRSQPGPIVPPRTVVIHAGRNAWKSKDVPEDLYQGLCDRLLAEGLNVVLIGKEEFKKHGEGYGAYRLKGADKQFLNADFLTTATVLQDCAMLISNDSAPIHMAGSSCCHIACLTIAKPGALIFPYRTGWVGWRTTEISAPKGHNQWDVAPHKVFYLPDDPPTSIADMVEGMRWPTVDEAWEQLKGALMDIS